MARKGERKCRSCGKFYHASTFEDCNCSYCYHCRTLWVVKDCPNPLHAQALKEGTRTGDGVKVKAEGGEG